MTVSFGMTTERRRSSRRVRELSRAGAQRFPGRAIEGCPGRIAGQHRVGHENDLSRGIRCGERDRRDVSEPDVTPGAATGRDVETHQRLDLLDAEAVSL